MVLFSLRLLAGDVVYCCATVAAGAGVMPHSPTQHSWPTHTDRRHYRRISVPMFNVYERSSGCPLWAINTSWELVGYSPVLLLSVAKADVKVICSTYFDVFY